MPSLPLAYARHRALFVISVCAVVLSLVSFWAARQRANVTSDNQRSIPVQRDVAVDYGKLPLSFESNQGQTDGSVRFLSRGPGYDVFLTGTDAVISLRKPQPFGDREPESKTATSPQRTSVLYLKMLGANPSATVSGQDELAGKINYFVGNDPTRWHTNIPTYRKVHYAEIFPGVDLVYYGNRTQLEYDFVLAPGADVSAVRFRIDGAQNVALDRAGDLQLSTPEGAVQLRAPVIYQLTQNGRQEVKGRYIIKGREIGFKVESFDRQRPLIIDPVLSYSTLLGSGGNQQGNGIAVDSTGNAYIVGQTNATGFPTTSGAFQTASGSVGGAFVTKLDPTGTSLIYSTYLSGTQPSFGNGIAIDGAGNAVITGFTTAADFPTLNPLRGGRNNLLITSDSGSNWSPSNVGTNNRTVQSLAIDKSSSATIYAGLSTNAGIFKSTNGGASWAALNVGVTGPTCPAIVIDPSNTSVVYAGLTFTTPATNGVYKSINGGSTWSLANTGVGTLTLTALAIDPQNTSTLYVSTAGGMFKTTNGGTSWSSASTGIGSQGFAAIIIDPATPPTVYGASNAGVYKTTNGGGNWGLVNTGLTNTTIRSLAIDPSTPATLYAGTANGGAFKTTNGGSNWAPINTGLPTNVAISSLAVDPNSTTNIFLGTADGRMFKSIDGGANWNIIYQTTNNTNVRTLVVDPNLSSKVLAGLDSGSTSLNGADVFLTKLNAAGSALIYSTFIGGNLDDQANGLALDASGNAFLVGQTISSDFPAVNAFQPVFGGSSGCPDAFITKVNSAGTALAYSTFLGGAGCDLARSVTTDSAGNAFVTGRTGSPNLATPGAFQTALGDTTGEAFAAKVTPAGALSYFTYLAGNNTDTGYGIAVDASGNAYVTGLTSSTNFPTQNAIQSTKSGSDEAFVTKLNSTGTGLIFSTYLGGVNDDAGRGIAVDASGNAYVTGYTSSFEFPVVAGALKNKSPLYKTLDGGFTPLSNDNYGLRNQFVSVIEMDRTNPTTVFMGVDQVLYRSTDGGRNWAPSMTGLTNPSVSALVVHPTTPSIVYLSSNSCCFGVSAGMFKSTDGGSSWSPANTGLNNAGVHHFVMDPSNPSTLYAVTGNALFKSTNDAGNWTQIGPANFTVVRLAIDPVTPTTLYGVVSGSGGILKSIDSGANWQPINTGLPTLFIGRLVIDPSTPTTLYATGQGGVFKSINGGANWTLINSTLAVPIEIALDPIVPSTIYASSSGVGVFKSADGGGSWAQISNVPRSVAVISVNPVKPLTVYVGSAGITTETDAFVSKLTPAGAFIYSTLLGGSNPPNPNTAVDQALGIAIDSAGGAYVTGLSVSSDFPAGVNSYQPFNRGLQDAFVSKLTMSYIISGFVRDGANAPISGAEVILSDGSTLVKTTTETDGSYQFSRLIEGGSFTVSASKPQFTMAPPSQIFNNLNGNQTLDFVATPTAAPFFTVGGQVTNNGTPLSGVTVTLSGSQQSFRTTDSNGNYSFTLASGGNYTVTPTILGFAFAPPSQTFNNLSGNQTANFAATRQNFVVTNANDHGTGSLRQAMLDANATPGLDTITFNIPGGGVKTIDLLLVLPIITDPIVIDATTQPGYSGVPLIELNGAQVTGNGLQLNVGNSTIRGLILNRFTSGGQNALWLNNSDGNTIQGNYFGTDPTGSIRRANNRGILANGSNNLIGGTTTAARNVISGSTFEGLLLNGSNNQVQGNFIGTNASGSAAIDNSNGIDLTGGSNNVIGGTVAGAGNLISGNQTGVRPGGSNNKVQGNLIGTDATGLTRVGNGTGILGSAPNTLIGGTTPEARNIISGNSGDGIYLSGAGSVIQGNFIGVDISGSVALGNTADGITTGTNTLVGGTVPGARNIISGNGGQGNIALGFNSSGSTATVQGNYIGTDVTGMIALTNPKPGISIQSVNNTIGGTTPEARNIISGNTTGIQIGGNTTGSVANNVVQGNFIGLNQAGTGALPNSADGIRIEALNIPAVGNNVIGGLAAGAGNVISFNGGNGVTVFSGTGNSIRGNSIVSNSGLGIDLAPLGITPNDAGDPDTGANNRQNFPLITSVTPAANPTTINGTLNSTGNTAVRIDFYSNTSCDSSGNGEGAQFLDTTTVNTAADGNIAFNYTLGSAVTPGRFVTATATDPGGSTSEFSPCTVAGTGLRFAQAGYSVGESGGSLDVTVTRVGDTTAAVTVDYSTSADNGLPCSTASGNATPKCDFTTALGTLNFASGETTKTVTVLISQDIFVEGPETFSIGLTNPTGGAAVVPPSSATITILDDVNEPSTNPADDPRNFVRQHYHDFLNREPDQAGWDFWTNQITSCGSDVQCNEVRRIDVSASFFLSIEFQQTGYLVERFYKVGYGDANGTSTFGGPHQLAVPVVRANEFLTDTQRIGRGVIVLAPGWEQALENNKQAYALEFVQTTRFISAFPTTMTPAQFVDKLNQNAGNPLSASERTTAINLFGGAADSSNTTARAQATRMVAEDQTLYDSEYNRSFVLAQYFGYLRRNPNDAPESTLDYTGYDFWLTKLNQFNGNYINAEMVKAFLSSIEYRQRFGP